MARKKSQNRIVLEHLEVIDAGAKGKAIAKAADGRVVFINNAVPGDIVSVQTTKKRKAYFEGTAIEIHKASDKRVALKNSIFIEIKWNFHLVTVNGLH